MDLVALAQEGSIAARNELIEQHMGLIKTIMKTPDSIQEGVLKVAKVIMVFRRDSGNSLTTVIWVALKRLRIDLARRQARAGRIVLETDYRGNIDKAAPVTNHSDLREAAQRLHHSDVAKELLAGTPKLTIQKKLGLTAYHYYKAKETIIVELRERLS